MKSVFYSFSTTEPIAFLQSGPYFFLLIGPLFLTYVQMLVKSKPKLNRYWKIHLAFWIFITLGLHLLLPFHHHVALAKEVLLPLINLQWLAYILVSVVILRPTLSKLQTGTPTQQWLCLLILAMLILWAVYFFVSFRYFISGSIAFSLLFYAFYIYFVFHKKVAQSIFTRVRRGNARIIKQQEANHLLERLRILMQEEKPFVNPNLKSVDIAQQLDISTHEFSHLINEYLNKTFTDFINEYRVEEAKQLIATQSRYTLEAIGNQSGFNSKSAFYKAFKKFQGTTPGRFKG
ncbi:MAG: helix-turn-helix domain-containing protein [Saprospiraceae bacterium]|nr:helix-turn-helix domain-containing protein [Saprospiraceae bacterium]